MSLTLSLQAEQDKIFAAQLAYETQLADPELIFRSISFVNLVSTWLIRQVDPLRKHPNPTIGCVAPFKVEDHLFTLYRPIFRLPLPQEVPWSFRVLPEYLIEDVIEYYTFVLRYAHCICSIYMILTTLQLQSEP